MPRPRRKPPSYRRPRQHTGSSYGHSFIGPRNTLDIAGHIAFLLLWPLLWTLEWLWRRATRSSTRK